MSNGKTGDTRYAIVVWRDDMAREVPERGLVVRFGTLQADGSLALPRPYLGAKPVNGRTYKTEGMAYRALSGIRPEPEGD